MADEEATLVVTAGTAMNGLTELGGLVAGESVVVTGPGPIGLLGVVVAKALGAKPVILTGTRDNRLAIGARLGADHVVNVRERDPVETVRELTGGRGVDYMLECSGAPNALNEAACMVNRGRSASATVNRRTIAASLAVVAGTAADPAMNLRTQRAGVLRNRSADASVPGHGYGQANVARLQVQVALREGNFDPVLVEPIPYAEQHFADDVGAPVFGVVNPDSDFEIHRAVAESPEQATRFGCGEHPLDGGGRLQAQAHGETHVGPVCDPHRDLQAHRLVAV